MESKENIVIDTVDGCNTEISFAQVSLYVRVNMHLKV